MLQALHAEWQKARRRHDLVLCLAFAVILYLWLGSTAPTGQDELANAYSALFFGAPIINTILLPVLMAVLASRLWDVEVKGYTAKLLYTLQSRRSLFFGKAVFGLGEIVLMVALEAAVLLLLGHTQGYTEAFPAGQFAYLNLCTLTVCTMLYFSELLLALWFSNPLPAVCVGIIGALLEAGIPDIECGNCKGLGAYAKADAKQAPSDEEYFEAVQPYLSRGRIGMFMLAKLADKELVRGAADAGLYFLRVGADAGDGAGSVKAVAAVKEAGLTCRYSLMKGYVLPAAELAKEAKLLQDAGVDRITIMDSAGTMFPDQTTEYVKALKDSVTIPVGFHGHSNLGLSQANALAAVAAGADEIDCGLLGMARSVGNCATELAAATLKRQGYLPEVDLFGLLHYLEDDLIPTMEPYHYHVAIAPVELMLGLSGCHSSFLPMFRKVAQEEGVSLLKLIAEASTIDRKAPSESLLRDVAKKLK